MAPSSRPFRRSRISDGHRRGRRVQPLVGQRPKPSLWLAVAGETCGGRAGRGKARPGWAWPGAARQGRQGRGWARHGEARLGSARQGRRGKAGSAGLGEARPGPARSAWMRKEARVCGPSLALRRLTSFQRPELRHFGGARRPAPRHATDRRWSTFEGDPARPVGARCGA